MVCKDCSHNESMTFFLYRPTNYRHGGERIIDVGILCCCCHRLSAGYLTTVVVNGMNV